mgnify:CR=1 FL=1|jgi:hypothetical protein
MIRSQGIEAGFQAVMQEWQNANSTFARHGTYSTCVGVNVGLHAFQASICVHRVYSYILSIFVGLPKHALAAGQQGSVAGVVVIAGAGMDRTLTYTNAGVRISPLPLVDHISRGQ